MNSSPAPAARPMNPFLQFLAQPWLDRSIALVATIPLLYLTYIRYRTLGLGVPLVCFATGTFIAFVTMITRRPPKRITPNPWYWLLAFVATYWALLTLGVIQKGHPITSALISNGVAIC